ncbi:MAG TPA: hypothetical protein VFH48_08730 [Chloroflexota bacterium]|nr:hypothetical protein [Chloroflexota bacterium]
MPDPVGPSVGEQVVRRAMCGEDPGDTFWSQTPMKAIGVWKKG